LDDAIILTLYDGEIHELDLENFSNYRRINFEKHIITIPADDLMLNRRDTANRSDREMTLGLMQEKKTKYAERKINVEERLQNTINKVTGLEILPENFADAQKMLNRYKEEIKQDYYHNCSTTSFERTAYSQFGTTSKERIQAHWILYQKWK
jgi:lipopolysaccharide export system permease protein